MLTNIKRHTYLWNNKFINNKYCIKWLLAIISIKVLLVSNNEFKSALKDSSLIKGKKKHLALLINKVLVLGTNTMTDK